MFIKSYKKPFFFLYKIYIYYENIVKYKCKLDRIDMILTIFRTGLVRIEVGWDELRKSIVNESVRAFEISKCILLLEFSIFQLVHTEKSFRNLIKSNRN